jgi:probable HAF family extracellular repeat protein
MLRHLAVVLCVFALVFAGVGLAWATNYTFYDLTVAGDQTSYAYGINSSNEVTGRCYPASGSYAFIWSPTAFPRTQIPTMSGTTGLGLGINDNGTVVGLSSSSGGNHAFIWTPTVANGNTGTTVDMGGSTKMPGTTTSRLMAINNSGQAVGYGSVGGQATGFYYNGVSTPMAVIPPPPSGGSSVGWLNSGINSSGLCVGYCTPDQAIYWHPGDANAYSMNGDIATMAFATYGQTGIASRAFGVNDSAEIVGYYTDQWSTTGFPFLYKNSTNIVRLGAVGGGNGEGHAEAVNANGYVVGWGNAASGQDAFLWVPDTNNGTTGTMIDLNSLPVASSLPSGYHFYDAYAINASGSIAGTLADASMTHFKAFALIAPVQSPEPSTLLLTATGLIGLIAYAWRKRK